MLYEITIIILAVMVPVFFVLGFGIGVRKGINPSAPIIPKKPAQQTREQAKMEKLSRNITNYVGNSDGQEKI